MHNRLKKALILLLATCMLVVSIMQENGNNRKQETKEFTAFFSVPGTVKDDYNEVQGLIADVTGAKCNEIWLVGQTQEFGIVQREATEVVHEGEAFWIQTRVLKWAGYPNDGSCAVDPETRTVIDYNVTPTAKRYFSILNEEYHAEMIDPESFTQTYSEYLEKLSSGRVLGMVDQWWQFAYDLLDEEVLKLRFWDIEGIDYEVDENGVF